MASHGIAVLRFDFAGLGESEGEFITTDFSTNITDILAAAAFLEEAYEAPSLLIGHSLGGAAVVFAGTHISSLKAVVTIGTPSNPAHVTHLFEEELKQIRENGKATVIIGGREFDVRSQFVDDLEQRDLVVALRNLRKPFLVMHAPLDEIVSVDHAATIYKAAFHPKSFVSLDGADHILTRKEDSIYVGEVIASWSKKYIPPQPEKRLSTTMDVVARLDDEDVYTTYIKAENHYLYGR